MTDIYDESRHAFSLLSDGARRWVSKQGWATLRPIQISAIESLLGGDGETSLVISAGTASGKTEAAFLPAVSMIQERMERERDASADCVFMLYVAPLKALINDQYRRLCSMTAYSGIPVYMWHGDAPSGQKKELLRNHSGILMTTPESLESFLMNRGQWCQDYMTPSIVVIDEFHAFIGDGRGKQLLSLLSRIDAICEASGMKPPTRIGLSATLSRLDAVGRILSPDSPCAVIDGTSAGSDETQIEITSVAPPSVQGSGQKIDFDAISETIVAESEGKKTLTFAKSRRDVEMMSSAINDYCVKNGVRSEAFPHHGSLSKETREALERRLVSTDKPTMAVATVTLELGIDIGDIAEVFQIGPTNSVASLRQRVGRSGRRDGKRLLHAFASISEDPADMQAELTTLIAEVELMRGGWFEPPKSGIKNASVLVQEILSTLTQFGSAYDGELFGLLCAGGAFRNIDRELFDSIVADMIDREFLQRSADGMLLLGDTGFRETQDWHFYATFQDEETYTVRSGGHAIGEITPPATSIAMLAEGGTFMLGGRYWKVVPPIDMANHSINVKQQSKKASFLVPTSRGGGDVNGMIKRKRISLLTGDDCGLVPDYIDEAGIDALDAAREYAREHRLNGLGIAIYDAGEAGSDTDMQVRERMSIGYADDAIASVEPPVDASARDAIEAMFIYLGMEPGGLSHIPLGRLHQLCMETLSRQAFFEDRKTVLIDDHLLADIEQREKYNGILSPDTLRLAYADEVMDVAGAIRWMKAFERFWENGRGSEAGRHSNQVRSDNAARRIEARKRTDETVDDAIWLAAESDSSVSGGTSLGKKDEKDVSSLYRHLLHGDDDKSDGERFIDDDDIVF